MRAIFYIDGFNFYYLRTRWQPQFKWLNMKALADEIVPAGTTVSAVKYYTAPVSGKIDHDAPLRQQKLLSALRTVPEVSIYNGRFLYAEKWAGLVQPPRAKPDGYNWALPAPAVVYVAKTEEKGSDVNLGVHLVRDAFLNLFDVAYVVTNDTDLVEPIRIVTQEVGKQVCIVAPCRPRGRTPVPAPSLEAVSSFKHYIDDNELAASQFPDVIHRRGKPPLVKPVSWA
ncbi:MULTISPECIES: NYN domain-containing protein [unclassified Shinella]|uniref:NYN domain-containing protein n=1 Tax=unclassified Shinella TaxID=2643062 RepID=UPI00234E906D|nr:MULTISPECIES: NYN domain-containing protein [unclassified Shinella]MCO5139966.1 NYN domain-containing protein [Shinella sp.]MDC7257018.1 NYN domain-containing protein [Shinella sp. YE25]